MPSGLGRALSAFRTVYAHPKLTFQLNQVTGGGFSVVTLTGSSTSDIEILSNSFTGPTGLGAVVLQAEGFARVANNLFTSCGVNATCITANRVATSVITGNTMTIPTTNAAGAGILVSGSGNATVTSNVILGGGLTGPATDSVSYRYRAGAIVVSAENTNFPFGNTSATGTASATVSQNSITNAASAFRVFGGGVSVTASNNTVSNVLSALRLDNLT